MSQINKEDYYTVAEFAKAIRVTPKTVHNWRREGRLACVPLPNGRFRIPSEEFDRITTFGTGQIIIPPSN